MMYMYPLQGCTVIVFRLGNKLDVFDWVIYRPIYRYQMEWYI